MTPERQGIANVCHVLLITIVLFSTSYPVHSVFAENYYYKNFEWHYKGYSWTWSLSIPQSLYNAYKRVSVSERTGDYSYLVTTTDSYVKQVVNTLHESATQEGYGAFDEVSFILAFVQSLPYTSDSVTTRYDEYPRFPIETLVDDGGDCEDTAILFATLVVILDYDAIFISPPKHLAVGVWGKDLEGYYFTYNAKKYYYCETTGEDWNIGDMPDAYRDISANLYPIVESRQYKPIQGGQTTPFFQLPREMLGIIVAGIAGLIIIVVVMLRARSAKAPKIGEPTPGLPTGMYTSDAEEKERARVSTMSTRYERMKTDVSRFFPSCPFCQKETIETNFSSSEIIGGKDYIVCSACQAMWHIFHDYRGLLWAKLTAVNIDGKGMEYLETKYEPTFWFEMIEKKPVAKKPAEKAATPQPSVEAKETVEQVESGRFFCRYCGVENKIDAVFCEKCGRKIA